MLQHAAAAAATLRLAKLAVDKVITAPCETSILYPKHGGNLHCFTAITPCAVLDILSPSYREDEGRKCTYYHDYSYSTIYRVAERERIYITEYDLVGLKHVDYVTEAGVEGEGQRSESLVKKRNREATENNEVVDPSVAALACCGIEDRRTSMMQGKTSNPTDGEDKRTTTVHGEDHRARYRRGGGTRN
ncbi:hypothetical protein Ahy_A07g034204 [Arachis hypogaea]|uniref:cysteine dioxygenase n=1 Tax=Arachis hypogaea TaxID=3818 RepID=A0A445CB84_ARAHY|nr:hypothetical protein Ahy_A07g034204 [Arachis hypogaea]